MRARTHKRWPALIGMAERAEKSRLAAIADPQLSVDYEVWSYPTLVVVDPAGRIARSHQGVLSRPELDELIDQLQREIPAGG